MHPKSLEDLETTNKWNRSFEAMLTGLRCVITEDLSRPAEICYHLTIFPGEGDQMEIPIFNNYFGDLEMAKEAAAEICKMSVPQIKEL